MSWSLLRAGKGGDKKKKRRQSCVAPGSIPSPGVTAVCCWALDEIFRKSTEVTARGGGTESAAEKGSG